MRHQALYRVGGSLLLFGAILFAVALMLHAPQPQTLADAAGMAMGGWLLSHWGIVLGTFFLVGGAICLSRHMGGGETEAWGALGLAGTALGGTAFILIVAPEIAAFPALIDAYNAGTADAGTEHTFLALNAGLMAGVYVAGPLFWLGMGVFAFAMTKDAAWPTWLAWGGVAVALVMIIGNFTFAENFTLFRVVFLVASLWIAAVGWTMMGMGRTAAPSPVAGGRPM